MNYELMKEQLIKGQKITFRFMCLYNYDSLSFWNKLCDCKGLMKIMNICAAIAATWTITFSVIPGMSLDISMQNALRLTDLWYCRFHVSPSYEKH